MDRSHILEFDFSAMVSVRNRDMIRFDIDDLLARVTLERRLFPVEPGQAHPLTPRFVTLREDIVLAKPMAETGPDFTPFRR